MFKVLPSLLPLGRGHMAACFHNQNKAQRKHETPSRLPGTRWRFSPLSSLLPKRILDCTAITHARVLCQCPYYTSDRTKYQFCIDRAIWNTTDFRSFDFRPEAKAENRTTVISEDHKRRRKSPTAKVRLDVVIQSGYAYAACGGSDWQTACKIYR